MSQTFHTHECALEMAALRRSWRAARRTVTWRTSCAALRRRWLNIAEGAALGEDRSSTTGSPLKRRGGEAALGLAGWGYVAEMGPEGGALLFRSSRCCGV